MRRKSYSCNFPSHMALHLLAEWVQRDIKHRSFQLKCSRTVQRGERFSGGWKVALWSTRSRRKGEQQTWHVGPALERAIIRSLNWAEKRGWA